MPTDNMMRIFKVDDGINVNQFPVKDSYANIAYGECATAASTTAKEVTLSNNPGWILGAGSIVIVHFTNAVPAASSLNVAETGAKNIYLKNVIIPSVIKAGDIVTFIYDGTKYIVTAIDRVSSEVDNKAESTAVGDISQLTTTDRTSIVSAINEIASSYSPFTINDVSFSIPVSSWTTITGGYSAEYTSNDITATSKEVTNFDASFRTYGKADIIAVKKTGGGGMVFTTSIIPTGTISGNILVFDNYTSSANVTDLSTLTSMTSTLNDNFNDLHLSLVDGHINITYNE